MSHTLQGVLGIARMTFVSGLTIAVSCLMVTPARMLMRSLPSSASFRPGSLSMACANCGLQLGRVQYGTRTSIRMTDHSKTTSDCWTACTLVPTQTSTLGPNPPSEKNSPLSLFALSS